MSDFNEIKELRFWCQKVLPLVYDDSLSYYELLCKVVHKLNEVVDRIDEFPEYIRSLITEEYLEPILSGVVDELREQIASINEHDSKTATADRTTGELVWLDGKLYRVTRNMLAGDQYFLGSNIEKVSVEILLNRLNNDILDVANDLNTEIADRIASETVLQSNIDTEEQDRKNADVVLQQNIDTEEQNRINADINISNYHGLNFANYNPDNTGVVDVSDLLVQAISDCVNYNNILYIPRGVYKISTSYYEIPSNVKIHGEGILECYGTTPNFLLSSTHDAIIEGLTFVNKTVRSNEHIISIYSTDVSTVRPHDILFKNLTFDCLVDCDGGLFARSCYNITVDGCTFIGGVRGPSFMSPIDYPHIVKNCIVKNCTIKNTRGYGVQTYYGDDYKIIDNFIDGTDLAILDMNCINIDRSVNTLVSGNVCVNSKKDGILIFGCYESVVIGNLITNCVGSGVLLYPNNERAEDPSIDEGRYNNVVGNNIDKCNVGINVEAQHFATISNNVVTHSVSTYDILVVDNFTIPATSENIIMSNNVCEQKIWSNAVKAVVVMGGYCDSLGGNLDRLGLSIGGNVSNAIDNDIYVSNLKLLQPGHGIDFISPNGTHYNFYCNDDGELVHV